MILVDDAEQAIRGSFETCPGCRITCPTPPVAVAFGDPGVSAFVTGGADLLGGLDLDQLLHHEPHRVTGKVNSFAGAERVQQLGQDRLGQDRLGQGHLALSMRPATIDIADNTLRGFAGFLVRTHP